MAFENGDAESKPSRRDFLKEAAALSVMAPMAARAQGGGANSAGRPVLAYVGTYSSPEGPEGSRGHGEGIYLFEVDPSSGGLTQRAITRNDANPSCLALDPSHTHLYSGNEITNYEGSRSGSLTAYQIDRATGHLTPLNTVSSEGAGPAYVSVHPSGKYLLVANYGGGTLAVIAIESNGELGAATDVHHDEGAVGPPRATSAPPGSFAISGHDHPHVHMAHSDPSGRFVLSTDLGMDKIFVWKFDATKGKLSPNNSVSLPPGDGPRHFAFHPNGRWMYSVQEEGSTVVFFDYDSQRGVLTAQQTVSSLPPGFMGTNFPSEIRVSSDGKFVYAANRVHDSVSWFTIGGSGELAFTGNEWTRGDYPRSVSLDPSGNFLYSCNQRADNLTAYRINKKTGALAFIGKYTAVGTPSEMVFLA